MIGVALGTQPLKSRRHLPELVGSFHFNRVVAAGNLVDDAGHLDNRLGDANRQEIRHERPDKQHHNAKDNRLGSLRVDEILDVMVGANRDNHPAGVYVARIADQAVFPVDIELKDAGAVINPVQNELVTVIKGSVFAYRNVVGIGDNAPRAIHYDYGAFAVVQIGNKFLQGD